MSRSHPSKLTLSKEHDGMELTHEEFAEADFEEPWRYERVNGRLSVMTPAGFEHNAAGQPFRNHIGAYALTHPELVEYTLPEAWIVIDGKTERIADFAVYLRSEEIQAASPERVPELIFEIVSRSVADQRRDYEEKREEYQRIDVLEYVIVDRFQHRLLILRLQDGTYGETELGPNDSYMTDLLPGLEIPLDGIL
jgi:Uma2 family endonuclease